MGHSSKFVFPLPGRKQKPASTAPLPISGPLLTKAQKVLGASEIQIDSVGPPTDSRWAWEAQSNSGISVSVSETTAGRTNEGVGPSSAHDGWVGSKMQRERQWEADSDVIPPALNRQPDIAASMVYDVATDASSLRRRQSSSTITSYYDKSKLPLSISQQTSNSAMAKGLPSKAYALLDPDGELAPEPRGMKKKKPSRLDLSSLLQKHRSPMFLSPEPPREHLLGSDMLTKSPSIMSVSSAQSPPPILQRVDRKIRKKKTRESLVEHPVRPSSPHGVAGRSENGQRKQPTKADVDLHNLYDHYEQRTFADAINRELHENDDYRLERPALDQQLPGYPTPPASHSGKTYLSPFPTNGARVGHSAKQSLTPGKLTEATLKGAACASSPASLPADCASVSSRHTRTSKASKRTDRSLTDIDLLQNSVLALSSDSEDDCELSSKGSLVVPQLSDEQASPTSSHVTSQRAERQDGNRSKPVKRASFAESPQFFPAEDAGTKPPKISARSSSLNSKSSSKQVQTLTQTASLLSVGSSSTERSTSRVSSQSLSPQTGVAAKKGSGPKRGDKSTRATAVEAELNFPVPPLHRSQQPLSRGPEQSPPVTPSSLDLYLQSHRSAVGHEVGSIHSGASIGSAILAGRRGSTASSINDGSSGRFMAVTRQEEMLLAALRMKRARMREDIIAEFEEEIEREEHQLSREMTNDSISTNGGMSRQSSRSTMRLETGALSARPRQKGTRETSNKGHEALAAGKTEIGSGLDHFLRYGDSVDLETGPNKGGIPDVAHVPNLTGARQRASLTATTRSHSKSRRGDRNIPRRGSGDGSPKGQKGHPHQILEDPAEDDEAGVPRPDSPISPMDFPAPASITNKKQVRLSAVGYYKPNIEAGWWGDSG